MITNPSNDFINISASREFTFVKNQNQKKYISISTISKSAKRQCLCLNHNNCIPSGHIIENVKKSSPSFKSKTWIMYKMATPNQQFMILFLFVCFKDMTLLEIIFSPMKTFEIHTYLTHSLGVN